MMQTFQIYQTAITKQMSTFTINSFDNYSAKVKIITQKKMINSFDDQSAIYNHCLV